jgi:DNA invertase Pin-like site-specific DNA recombinase
MARPKKLSGNPTIAIAYLRVSTTDQRVDQQRDAIERWAKHAGITIAAWLADEGISGAAPLDQRPALLEALACLRANRAGLLVAAKRDRLARDVSTAAAIERLTREAGATVVTADGIDSSDTAEGALMRTLIDAIAQYERALIRARTKAALLAKSKRGEVVGGIPFGKRGVGGMLVDHDGEQAALARMRSLKALGATQSEIVNVLTKEGHRARGRRWHVTTIQRALALEL